ncbi:MAG: molybdate ABC transporter substrate-binding protein [Deltaproteobacteria bacterium]|nr:molybdate ABC transporter substrate-binding protein [Deltaproteobacteria bacterium]
MKIRSIVLLLALFMCSHFPQAARSAEVRLSAAASLTEAIKEIGAGYIKEHPEMNLQTNFGASGALAKQIVAGAPADLFISADSKWLDYLVKEGKVSPAMVRVLTSNTLVLVGDAKNVVASLGDVTKFERVAMGSPGSVPAGLYAEQAMRSAGVYEKLQAGKKLVMAQDVRQALLYADRGEVDAAFVYRTDGLLAKKAVILYTVPAELHEPITYPLALTVDGEKNGAARGFYDYLAGPEAKTILEKYGFTVGGSAAGSR